MSLKSEAMKADECSAVFHGLKVSDYTRQPIFSDLKYSNGSVSFASHFLTHWNTAFAVKKIRVLSWQMTSS